jgi:hypothetical protein
MKASACDVRHGDREIPLEKLPVLLERGSDAETRVLDRSVSRRQSEISERDGTDFVRELGSTNDSFVNSRYASESSLRSGDICQTSGLYLASGACGHAGYQRVTKGEAFPTCRACGKAACKDCAKVVNWTFRETYSPLLLEI